MGCGQGCEVESTSSSTLNYFHSVGVEFPPEAHVQIMDLNTGRFGFTNQPEPVPFDCEVASGSYVMLHRPLPEDMAGEGFSSPSSWPLAAYSTLHQRKRHLDNYFEDKRRNWEVRFQLTFKKRTPASVLRFGTQPAERMPLTNAQLNFHRLVLRLAKPVIGDFYNSPGDDPAQHPPGEVERPITSVNISEADQYCFSRPWEAPLGICDAGFEHCGVKKVHDPAGFKKSLRARVFEVGETHSFAFWGPSWFTNVVRWQLVRMPLVHGLSMDVLNGRPPLILTLYVKRSQPGETRHLDHLTDIVWRAAGWPSMDPPPLEKLKYFFATGPKNSSGRWALPQALWLSQEEQKKRKPQQQKKSFQEPHSCCGLGLKKLLSSTAPCTFSSLD